MKVTVTVDCDNAAFEEDLLGELSRALAIVAQRASAAVEDDGPKRYSGGVMDSWGNTCAFWSVEP